MRVKLCVVAKAPPPGKGASVRSEDGRVLALFNVSGEDFASEDRCPHMDSPIHDGTIHRGIVTCLWHMWQFDIKSGECLLNEHIKLAKFPTSVENGVVYADLP